MTTARTITPLVVILTAAAGALPDSALAGSLLSGYGGPGQGNQAILGAALLRGPGGGTSGGGTSGGGSSATGNVGGGNPASGSSARASGSSTPDATNGAAATGRSRVAPPASSEHGRTARAPERATSAVKGADEEASRSPRQESASVGFSGDDILFALLALGALVCTGVVTRRLAQTTGQKDPGS